MCCAQQECCSTQHFDDCYHSVYLVQIHDGEYPYILQKRRVWQPVIRTRELVAIAGQEVNWLVPTAALCRFQNYKLTIYAAFIYHAGGCVKSEGTRIPSPESLLEMENIPALVLDQKLTLYYTTLMLTMCGIQIYGGQLRDDSEGPG